MSFDQWMIAANIVLTAGLTALGFVLNGKQSRIENMLAAVGGVLDKEAELKIEAKRIGRDKALPLMAAIDMLFERLKFHSEDDRKDLDKYLRIDLLKQLWAAQIYLHNEVYSAMMAVLTSAVRALGHWATVKYWEILEQDVADKYLAAINTVRRVYYFESEDMTKELEDRIRQFKADGGDKGTA